MSNTYPGSIEKNSTGPLSIFYDSKCPLCVAEMEALRAKDTLGQILAEDIHDPGFGERHPDIELSAAMKALHGKSDGRLLVGLDVSKEAWHRVAPKSFNSRLLTLARRPLFRKLSDTLYTMFARHRYFISFVFTGKRNCQQCNFSPDSPDNGSQG